MFCLFLTQNFTNCTGKNYTQVSYQSSNGSNPSKKAYAEYRLFKNYSFLKVKTFHIGFLKWDPGSQLSTFLRWRWQNRVAPPLPILYNITTDEKKIGKYTVGGKKYKEKYNAFATNSNWGYGSFFPE